MTAFLIMRSDSNARYVYAMLPVLTIPFGAVVGWTASHNRLLYRALIVCIAAWAGLNIYFIPASGWYHRDFYSPYTFARHGSERYLEQAAPERLVIRRYNQLHPGSTLLLTADTNIADVKGDVYENSWHQWDVAISIQHALAVPDMKRLFDRWKVQYVVSPTRQTGVTLQPSLRDFLDGCSAPEYELGGYGLLRLTGCKGDAPHIPARVNTRPLPGRPRPRRPQETRRSKECRCSDRPSIVARHLNQAEHRHERCQVPEPADRQVGPPPHPAGTRPDHRRRNDQDQHGGGGDLPRRTVRDKDRTRPAGPARASCPGTPHTPRSRCPGEQQKSTRPRASWSLPCGSARSR